jgi:hypothetical protein
MHTRSTDDRDNDPTDELPVLLESAGLDEDEDSEPLVVAPRAEDTAEHTALFAIPLDPSVSDDRLAELTAQAEQVPALEAQVRALTDAARGLEQRLAEKDDRLEELRGQLADLQRARDDTGAAERRLATELALRDARLAELAATVERREQEAAAYAAELQRLFEAAEAAKQEAASLREELAARAPAATMDVDALREDHAALTAYIAGRRAWWEDMEARNTQLAARAAALEHELGVSAKRLAAADAFAAQESSRAVALRAELVDYARRIDTLERELRLTARADTASEPSASSSETADVQRTAAPATAGAMSDVLPPAVAAPLPSPQAPPILTDAVETPGPGVEALAQLEAEVEYKRQQVAAQLVELRDREQRLRATTGDLDRVQRELGTLRTELDESRTNASRLERAVIDKDRALEARDARIATLQDELKQRPGSAEKREAAGPDTAQPARAAARESDGMTAPALICLTGDALKRFALTRKTVTIGRGPHCDLQVVTHFVSREHARVSLTGAGAFIEDLGSRNGVFVNSVRVDRHQLQQGDLLTIGETQFRFIESMAH